MSLKELLTLPTGVSEAAAAIAALDRCFLVGFGRLGPEQQQALQAFGRIFAGSPLGEALTTSLAALSRNEFVERHFAVLAAARAALQGAQYDALRSAAATALGRTLKAVPVTSAASSGSLLVPWPCGKKVHAIG